MKTRDRLTWDCSKKGMRGSIRHLLAFTFAGVLGCRSHQPCPSKAAVGEFHRIQGKGIENFYALGNTLYSGSSPLGEEGFATLQKLGVKTIISVDGAAPEAERAAKHGMRYVHLPIGYDGTTRSNALRIVKAAQVSPGPIFIHCHHGMHRGPTAAALVCEGLQGWSSEQAQEWLRVAGTATNYPGLYRTVREFEPPTKDELRQVPKRFTPHAQTPDLVNTMVQIDEHFEVLKSMQKVGFKPLPDYPDVTPATESLLLYELFKEAHRTGQGHERGEQFIIELGKAETSAESLHGSLKNSQSASTADPAVAESAFQSMTKGCAACHKAYRN